jgi:hypothetical protein
MPPGTWRSKGKIVGNPKAIPSAHPRTRERCVICGHRSFDAVFRLEQFPTFMGATAAPRNGDAFVDMHWSACRLCGTVQLSHMPPVNAVYPKRHTEALGQRWASHKQRFEAFLSRHAIWPVQDTDRISMCGRALTAPSFRVRPRGTFVHSHAMEHWREPRLVLQALAQSMLPGSRMIFSVPAMDMMLAQGLLSTLNFEHT